MEFRYHLRNVQDLPADGQTPNERRFNSPLSGPIIPFEVEVKCYRNNIPKKNKVECISSVQNSFLKKSLHPPWTRGEVRLVIFSITDTEDLQTIQPSEMHVKCFNWKAVEILMRNTESVFSMQNGRNLAKGTAVVHRYVHSVRRLHAGLSAKFSRRERRSPGSRSRCRSSTTFLEESWKLHTK